MILKLIVLLVYLGKLKADGNNLNGESEGGVETHPYPQFSGLSLQQLALFGGGPVNSKFNYKHHIKKHHTKKQPNPNQFNSLPQNFNVWDKWPECDDGFREVYVQGNCSASWAIATATSIRDRQCIKFGDKTPISAWDVLTCCDECKEEKGNGCLGGDHFSAFDWFADVGIVTGGNYHSRKGCLPYQIGANDLPPTSTQCKTQCERNYKKSYENDKYYGLDLVPFSQENDDLMQEIYTNGPVVAQFKFYTDFLAYTGGIYKHVKGDLVSLHYVKIVGWGVDEQGRAFWKAVNSWGKNWGNQGTFMIARNSDECGFESNIVAGVVKQQGNGKTSPKTPTTRTTAEFLSSVSTSTPKSTIKTTSSISTSSSSVETTSTTQTQSTTIPERGDEISCSTVILFYKGTFQLSDDRYLTFPAQFQVKLEADESNRLIKAEIQHWNETVSNSSNFKFEFYTDKDQIFYNIHDKNCSISYNHQAKYFNLRLWSYSSTKPGATFFISLFEQYFFNMEFVLNSPIDQCTDYMYGSYNNLDWELYKRCACCGGYNPSPFLNCARNPWEMQESFDGSSATMNNPLARKIINKNFDHTPYKHKQRLQKQPLRKMTDTSNLVSRQETKNSNVRCPVITAYYVGTFQNTDCCSVPMDVQFQVKFVADMDYHQIYFVGEHWNSSVSKENDHYFIIGPYGDEFGFHDFNHCQDFRQTNCSVSFDKDTRNFYFKTRKNTASDQFFVYVETNFNGSFSLPNAIGQCTNYNEARYGGYSNTDPNTYQACFCCGEYLPDPALNCPVNPWSIDPTLAPTIPPPVPKRDIICPSVTVYYEGTLASPEYDNFIRMDVQFQVKFDVNFTDQRIYMTGQHWNSLRYNSNLLIMDHCKFNDSCSFAVDKNTNMFRFGVRQGSPYGRYNLFTQPITDQGIMLYNAVGQCSHVRTDAGYIDQSLYDGCACCGEYKPDPWLNCPKNPWAT